MQGNNFLLRVQQPLCSVQCSCVLWCSACACDIVSEMEVTAPESCHRRYAIPASGAIARY